MSHTKLPWAIDRVTWKKKDWASLLDKNNQTLMIKCQNPDELGWAVSQIWGDNDKEAQANAALIVTAVNSHQAMKEALEKLVRYWGKTGPDYAQYDKLEDYVQMAKRALTLANGGMVEDTTQNLINQVRHLHD